ncbi:hypothetical protein D3C83_24490 [compost metagenome]
MPLPAVKSVTPALMLVNDTGLPSTSQVNVPLSPATKSLPVPGTTPSESGASGSFTASAPMPASTTLVPSPVTIVSVQVGSSTTSSVCATCTCEVPTQ